MEAVTEYLNSDLAKPVLRAYRGEMDIDEIEALLPEEKDMVLYLLRLNERIRADRYKRLQEVGIRA